VDANQGWTPKETIQFVDELDDQGVDLALLEQPVHRDDIAGLSRTRDTVDVSVAADEAVFSPEDVTEISFDPEIHLTGPGNGIAPDR